MGEPTVVLLSGDLMFGSKVEAMIKAAGAGPVLATSPDDALVAIADSDAQLLIVDLVTDAFDGRALAGLSGIPTIGFYAHTDDQTRTAALAAGFRQVVPRSRMMREGERLIAAALAGD